MTQKPVLFLSHQQLPASFSQILRGIGLEVENMGPDSLLVVPNSCDPTDCMWGARQAPLSMEFSRQEYWSGLPFPSPGCLLDPGIEPTSPAFQADSLPSEPPGKPHSFPSFLPLHAGVAALGRCPVMLHSGPALPRHGACLSAQCSHACPSSPGACNLTPQ